MTPNDEKLSLGLRALALSDPGDAPASVELALLKEFRKQKARHRQAIWLSSVAAIAAAVALALIAPRPGKIAPPEARQAHIEVPNVLTPGLQRDPVPRPVRPSKRLRSGPAPETVVASGFYRLPHTAVLAPLDYGTVVRVQLPRTAMRYVGLPVNEDRLSERIEADVLVGQDGLARAVRFVQ